MKRFLLLLPLLFVCAFGFSQQEAQYTQNMFNILSYNPAYAGSHENNAICLTGFYRQQWTGFKQEDNQGNKSNGGPQDILFSIDAPLKLIHGGIGVVINQDKLGFETNLNLKLALNYRLNLAVGNIAFGLMAGFNNKAIDYSKFKPGDAIANGGSTSDPTLLAGMNTKQSDMITDISFGVFYKNPQKLYVGLSSTQLLQSSGAKTGVSLKRTYFLQGGYYWPFPNNPSFELIPSTMIKTDFASAQYDIDLLLRYNNKIWGGLGYRVQDAIMIMLGMEWKNFNIGYSYDLTTSALGSSSRSSGTHEIMLRYCFKIVIPHPPTGYKNTIHL